MFRASLVTVQPNIHKKENLAAEKSHLNAVSPDKGEKI